MIALNLIVFNDIFPFDLGKAQLLNEWVSMISILAETSEKDF